MEEQAKTPSVLPASAPRTEASRKVVIRYADGRLLRGFLAMEDDTKLRDSTLDSFTVESSDGKLDEVRISEIKAIFFVKRFEGNPDYSEFKVFTSRPCGKGVWVRVRFRDGEVIEGVAPNRFETYSQPVFYMIPPDPASNNQSILVSKRFLSEMQVLGLASD